MRIINVDAGAAEFVIGEITETNGLDIATDTVQVSLGTQEQPAAWTTPHPDTLDTGTLGTVRAGLLIDDGTPNGEYWLWLKLDDQPETVPRRVSSTRIRVINTTAQLP